MKLTSVSLPLASTTSTTSPAISSVVPVVATVVVGHLEKYVVCWCFNGAARVSSQLRGTRIALAFGLPERPEAPIYGWHVTLTSIWHHYIHVPVPTCMIQRMMSMSTSSLTSLEKIVPTLKVRCSHDFYEDEVY
jgi:hypothetical protein